MKKLIYTTVLLSVCSCGYPRLPAIGDDATGAGEAQLTALEPSIANTNDVLTLEGTFGDTVTAQFPGGESRAATVLGPHRATVTVPVTATDGDLVVTTSGSRVGPLPFRRAPFLMGLGVFEGNLEQPEGARQVATLTTPRANHTSVVIGNYLYVLGGVSAGLPLSTVERAMIHADGSPDSLTPVPGVSLVLARYAHTVALVGSYLYVVGGFDNKTVLNSVERAPINADGSLGPFAIVADVTLTVARQNHTSVIVGNYLYALGGAGSNGSLNSVERAMLHPDGSLDPFAIVPSAALVIARSRHTSAVIGNHLYLIGGFDNNNALNSIEQATINADGSLEAFVIASSVALVTARNNHSNMVLGNHLYVIGGVGTLGALSSVEQATINMDGSLSPFTTLPDIVLASVRSSHTSEIIGNYLYLLGGLNNSGPSGIERATINAGSSLGAFTTVPLTLVTAREAYTSTVIGRYLYLIAGYNGNSFLNSVERAIINTDGSLEPFETVPDIALVTPRNLHAHALIGKYLYVVGGMGSNGQSLNSIERATVNQNGSLGPFGFVSGVALSTIRHSHNTVVIGDYLYVSGGVNNGSVLNSVERAKVNADGSLGQFAPISVGMVTERYSHTSAVVENYLYVFGGVGNSGTLLKSTERAMINADGSLGSFGIVSAASLVSTRRGHASAVVGRSLYVFGGATNVPPVSLSSVERAMINADGSLSAFVTVLNGNLTIGRDRPTSAVVGNYLYVLGGLNGSALNSIERATLTTDAP